MRKQNKTYLILALAAAVLVAGSAAAASYITKEQITAQNEQSKPKKLVKVVHPKPVPKNQQMASNQPLPQQCDDGNVLGYLAGGVGGGIVGSQVGKGHGNTAATIGGTLGGAYLGGQYLPMRNATCRTQ